MRVRKQSMSLNGPPVGFGRLKALQVHELKPGASHRGSDSNIHLTNRSPIPADSLENDVSRLPTRTQVMYLAPRRFTECETSLFRGRGA